MSELFTIHEGELELNLHAGQTRAWDSEARFVFMLAGTQGGKTSFAPWWLYREIFGGERNGRDFAGKGGGDYLAVTSSYDLFKLKFLPAMREVFETIFKVGRYWAGDKVIELADPDTGKFWTDTSTGRMWGRIILRSAVAGGGLESATAKAALLDECGQDEFTLDTWEAVLRRLSLNSGRVLGTTTLYNTGWLKSEVYDRWKQGDSDYDVIQFASMVNPSFPIEEFNRAKETMQDHRFLMAYLGQFAKPPGLIYNAYDELYHCITPFDIPDSWPRYVGVDFGGENHAEIWIAEDSSGDLYAYREVIDPGKTTKERAARMKGYGEPVMVYWGGAPGETQQRRDFGVEGIEIHEPPVADVESGIDRVQRFFKPRRPGGRLFVFDELRGLRDELGSYSRVLDANFNPTDDINAKRMYHRLDALRYVCSGLVGRFFGVESHQPYAPVEEKTDPFGYYRQQAVKRR